MNAPTNIKILVVDDHFMVRIGLASTLNLEADLEVIAEAENAEQALVQFRQHQPDVALIDLRLPGADGIETMMSIRREFPDARIIILSTYGGDADIYRALQAGARAYLLKSMKRAEMLQAIRAVHEGKHWIPPAVAVLLAGRIHGNDLTPRELEVLQLAGKGLSNKAIAAELSIVEGTVKIHINNIFGKLGVKDRTQAVTQALQRGIIHLN